MPLEEDEETDNGRGAQQPAQWKSFRKVAWASSKNSGRVVWEVKERVARLVLEIEMGCLVPEASV